MTRSGVAWQNTTRPTTKVPPRKTMPRIPVAVRLKKTMPPIAMAARPKTTMCIAVAAWQTTLPCNAMVAQYNIAAYHRSGLTEDNEAGYYVASPCASLLSSCHATLLLCLLIVAWPQSNATAAIKRHRHWSLLSTAATAAAVAAAGLPPPPPPPPWLN
jgi:hypothetical protein